MILYNVISKISIKLWIVIGINLNNLMDKKQKYKSE